MDQPLHLLTRVVCLLLLSLIVAARSVYAQSPPVSLGIEDVSVFEDDAGTLISLFAAFDDPDTPDENLIFSVQSNSNPLLVTPTVDAVAGTLSLAYVANASGTSTITVRATDPDNLFAEATFTVTVTAINDAPSFNAGTGPVVNEDTGAQSLVNWATSISPGPADETGQGVNFLITGNTNPGLFAVAPSVTSTGTLSYTPAADAFGSSTITLVLEDDGGTLNGGVNQSPSQSFTITVNGINDEPSFTKGSDVTVLEDAAPQTISSWATNIFAGPNEETQNITFILSPTNTNLFSAGPSISSTGTLTFTPAPNAFGTSTVTVSVMDDGGTANGGDNESPAQTFNITISAQNDPPTTSGIADVTVNEDASASSINLFSSFDDVEDSDAALSYQLLGNTNTALFSLVDLNEAAGTLILTYAPDAFGSAVLTVRVTDTQGLFVDEAFSVTVNPVNDAPSFTKGPDQIVNEDAGLQTIPGWATAISSGPINEASQTLTFSVTTASTALFSVQPSVTPTGTLTYQPAPDASGVASLTVTLQDNGGTANGGVNTSTVQTFSITINALNDPPTTTGIANVQDLEDAQPEVIDLFSAFDDAEDADNQLVYAILGNTNPALFSGVPVINGAAGTLTLTYAPNVSGTSNLTVRASDTGGLFIDTSFNVSLTAVNDAPSFTKGPDQIIAEDALPQAITGWATAISPGPLDEAAQVLTFDVSNDNTTLFSAQPTVSANGTLSYAAAPNASGLATMTVTLTDNGGVANGGIDASLPQTFTITVTPANDPPIAVDDAYIVLEGQSLIASAGGSPPGVLDNDIDGDGDALSATVLQAPKHAATWSFNTNGSFVYVHDGSENLTDSLTYIASDGTDNSNVAKVIFEIRETNDAPVAVGLEDVTALEDAANGLVSLFAAFDDPDDSDSDLTFSIIQNTNPALFDGLSTDPATGNLSINYADDANGTATLTVEAMDPGGLTAQTSFKVTLTPVNDPPVMNPGNNITLDEDPGEQTLNNWATGISPGPSDEQNQTVTIAVTNSNPALFSVQPTLTINGSNGTLKFTPAPETAGQATVSFTLSDNGGILNGGDNTNTYETVILVKGDNDAPTSIGIADIAPLEDASITPYNLFEIFDDVEDPDASLTFSIESAIDEDLFDAVTITGSPATLSIELAAEAFGTAAVTVRATDTGGLWAQETFEVDVLPVNDMPSFTAGSDIAIQQNAPPQTIENWATDILAGPANEANQTLAFTVTNDNEGLFGTQPALSSDGTLTFAPAIGEQIFGEAEVTVILSDNGGTDNGGVDQSEAITFTLSIRRFNTAPTANDDNYIVEQGSTLQRGIALGVLANDTDPEDDPLTARLVQPPANAAAFTLNPDGSFSYRHNNSQTTNDAFTYVANDGFDDSNVATVVINIQPLGNVQCTPVQVLEDAENSVINLYDDCPGFAATQPLLSIASISNNALFATTVLDSLSGVLTLDYAANQFGNSTITFNAQSSTGQNTPVSMQVTVAPLNDAPIAVDDIAATIVNRPIEVDVLANDVDFDGDALIIRTFSNPNTGTVEPQFSGKFLFTPEQDFTGEATFTYSVEDDSLASDQGVVKITVFSGRFNIADLGPNSEISAAYSISDAGEVVGVTQTASGEVQAFSSGQDLGVTAPSEALGANDFGQVVGALAVPGFNPDILTFQATRWDTSGTTHLGAFDNRFSKAYNINNGGLIVGVSTRAKSEVLHAFIWEDGEMTPLATDLSVESQAFDLNERGQVAGFEGTSAAVWDINRTLRRLSGPQGRAYDINESGQVIGSLDDGTVKAVLWDTDGTQQSLHDASSTFSEAYGINNATWVVGAYLPAEASKATTIVRHVDVVSQSARAVLHREKPTIASAGTTAITDATILGANNDLRAFLWQGDTMVDLNDFIDASSGWTLLEARGINNAAQITGIGLFNGVRRAFLLSPTNNKAPTVTNDRLAIEAISVTRINVLTNDHDADGDTLHIVAVTQGQAGSVTLEPGDIIAYTPGNGFTGSDSFTYTVADGKGGRATGTVSVEIVAGSLPDHFVLKQNYPNPFNPSTTIAFGLPEKAHVTIEVFNMLGQRIATLVDGERSAGQHLVTFDASNLPGGTYLYRMRTGRFSDTKKLILLK